MRGDMHCVLHTEFCLGEQKCIRKRPNGALNGEGEKVNENQGNKRKEN
jgi:hypothetical protein